MLRTVICIVLNNLKTSALCPTQASRLRSSSFALVAMSNGVSFQQGMFHFADCEPANNDAPYFLECCYLCRKRLRRSSDIFMYRGSMPFCSTECREEQILIDESKERNWRKMCASGRSSMRNNENMSKLQVHVA